MQSLFQSDLFLQVSGITPERAAALIPVALGLISVIIGRMALVRSARHAAYGQLKAGIALVMGVIGIVLSVLHLVRATGGIGTGSGRLGAMVALGLGFIGVMLGGLALARVRRIARRKSSDIQLK